CVSRSACVAVGNTSNSRGTSLATAQRWNGHTWAIQPTPSPADGGNLTGISCPSRSSCLAVGGHGNPFTGPATSTPAERSDGRRWRIRPPPTPPGGGCSLLPVSCPSPSACTAVGGRLALTPGPGLATLAERWDGHTWRIQPTANPPGRGVKLLNGVACTSRSSCMAVGNEFDPATGESLGTLAERWDGRTWQIVPTVKPAPAGPRGRPQRRGLPPGLGVHGGREPGPRQDAGRAVERPHLARPGHPQPAGRPGNLPRRRGLPGPHRLHRGRAQPDRLRTADP